jgi:hypothetical protein
MFSKKAKEVAAALGLIASMSTFVAALVAVDHDYPSWVFYVCALACDAFAFFSAYCVLSSNR